MVTESQTNKQQWNVPDHQREMQKRAHQQVPSRQATQQLIYKGHFYFMSSRTKSSIIDYFVLRQ